MKCVIPARAAGGQPAEAHREEVDQHQPEPEARDGLAQHGAGHADVVPERAAAHRGEHPGGDGEAGRQEERGARERERGGQALEDEAEGVLLVAQRFAEIPERGAPDEPAVLDDQGIVEAEALAELVDVLCLDVHGQEEDDGVPAQAHEEEDRGQGEEDHERRLTETGQEVRAHGRSLPSAASSGIGRRG